MSQRVLVLPARMQTFKRPELSRFDRANCPGYLRISLSFNAHLQCGQEIDDTLRSGLSSRETVSILVCTRMLMVCPNSIGFLLTDLLQNSMRRFVDAFGTASELVAEKVQDDCDPRINRM